MRQVYAHHATVVLDAGADPAAPDALITEALRGASHHTARSVEGDRLRLRVLFATAPDRVDAVRSTIDAGLAAGPWRVLESGCARLDPAERPQARQLLKGR
ncbi:hypothetical protein GCM10010168_55390 [Actinoplanes ianthinogenes]|uniref:Uncharacterized protein n=1 Tax=Actinoplanes ianthinogenes TaxID=122358 RepID=A0ABN6C8A5_9ACTN|nr:hypothetical protein [Actinoplanes ianthinogenes]BCJ41462.1 hypothetical protein Aiant_21190 [Actinoplanes ianthinogenes]GGR29934.1 hypothetical protein GCM10010168_55390 [Actinoplanes ianthinogenes]